MDMRIWTRVYGHCTDMYVAMCTGMCMNSCLDMCTGMYVDMSADVHMDTCVYLHRHVHLSQLAALREGIAQDIYVQICV